jgi:hypothetical protein
LFIESADGGVFHHHLTTLLTRAPTIPTELNSLHHEMPGEVFGEMSGEVFGDHLTIHTSL